MGKFGLSIVFAFVAALVTSGTVVTTGIRPGLLCANSLSNCETILPIGKNIVKIFSLKQKGQILEVKAGESFLLVLPNPGSGGYIVQDPEFDSQILALQKMEKKPPSDPSSEGDFGSLEWTFQAKKEGISVLIIRVFRPWEKDKAPTVIFEASIEVSQ